MLRDGWKAEARASRLERHTFHGQPRFDCDDAQAQADQAALRGFEPESTAWQISDFRFVANAVGWPPRADVRAAEERCGGISAALEDISGVEGGPGCLFSVSGRTGAREMTGRLYDVLHRSSVEDGVGARVCM